MKYILYDYEDVNNNKTLESYASENTALINAAHPMAKCIGCFKCWLKNPGVCVFSDQMQHIGTKLLTSEEIIIICKSLYGGFSVNVKRIIDRVIPGILPFFIKQNGELHHKQRYKNSPKITVLFYNGNEMSANERAQAEKLLSAAALNFHAIEHKIIFLDSPQEVLLEAKTWTY